MFRSTDPRHVAGLDRGGKLGGIDARSAMIQGGLIDGLANLADSFIKAPIARRKMELAEKKRKDDARLRELNLSYAEERNKRLVASKSGSSSKPISSHILKDINSRVDQEAVESGAAEIDDITKKVRVTDPAAYKRIRSKAYLEADLNPDNYQPISEGNAFHFPMPSEKEQLEHPISHDDDLSSVMATTPKAGPNIVAAGMSGPELADDAEPDADSDDLSQDFYPAEQDEDLANQFEGGTPDAIPSMELERQKAEIEFRPKTGQAKLDEIDPEYLQRLTSNDPATVQEALRGIPAGERLEVIRALKQMRANARPTR